VGGIAEEFCARARRYGPCTGAGAMRTLVSLSLSLVAVSAALVGCSSSSEEVAPVEDEAAAIARGDSLVLEMAIAESKVVFGSRLESFRIKSGAESSPCRERAFHLTSAKSLFEAGWSPERAADFSEKADGARFHDYVLASCRDASSEVLAWFGKERDIELSVGDTLLDEDYRPASLPLLLRHRALPGGAPAYYACSSAFRKTQTGETENAKRFAIEVTCKKRAAPTAKELGPIEFVSNPGPYAAVASYKPWMLPAVPSTPASFQAVKAALVDKVPAGTYAGAMSTLTKGCNLRVDVDGDKLVIEHVIQSSRRKRRIEVTADKVLGFASGDVYADPIRVEGTPTGTFAAVEVDDGKGGSEVIRFEKNTNAEGRIVRIDGAEAYCRRLATP